MSWVASAPGKLVVLGEYLVLDGAPALVMAVNRRCEVRLRRSDADRTHLSCRMPDPIVSVAEPGQPTGVGLVDAVVGAGAAGFGTVDGAFEAEIDSRSFFAGRQKLGLGSSAAALVAFAGAWQRLAGSAGPPPLNALIACHRAFQRGAGSGIDVAAALAGGVLEFVLDRDRQAKISSVRLPKSVAFASVFAGGSASTPDLVGRYRRWADTGSAAAVALRDRMSAVAGAGCAAVREQDAEGLVTAVGAYGRCIADLGEQIGADLVTAAHRQIGDLAEKLGLAYKVSGAGGGDVGIACALDRRVLDEFADRVAHDGFTVVELDVDATGLRVEERAA